jgi:DNA-binding PadR family transcriptional regulator
MYIHNMSKKKEARPSSLGVVVLGMLTGEPMHAYRMQKLMKLWGKDTVVNIRRPTSVYQTLERLLRLGLIEILKTVQKDNRPDRIVYQITDQGRVTVKAWLNNMLQTVGSEFPDFPAAVSMLVLLTPDEARSSFEIRARAVMVELSRLEDQKRKAGDLPRLFLLEDAYRTALLEAERVWLQSAISDLAEGFLTWDEKWVQAVAAQHTPPLHDEIHDTPTTSPPKKKVSKR